MSLSADKFLDRIRLKAEIVKWRTLTIVVATLLGFVIVGKSTDLSEAKGNYIARVSIEGIIVEDRDRDERMKVIKDDKSVKAVILYINSPGGTIVGGETLYNSLRDIAQVKPVVAVLGSLAASGGYMAAIAADHIFTRQGTITGSIGVMLQTAEFTEMAKKLGINLITFKSGELKGQPSPMEALDPKAAKVIQDGVADGFDFFVGLVENRRPLSDVEARSLADGRIFTGRQAVKNKLVDAIGGEDEAINWLETERQVEQGLKVKDVKTKEPKGFLDQFYSKVMGNSSPFASEVFQDGMMIMWKP